MASDSKILVAAIDFGTAYSGYAFSLKCDFEKDASLNIHTNIWNAGEHRLLSHKTPTCLLLDRHGQLDSFGFDAENKYINIALDGKQDQWHYYRQFKMKLHEEKELTLDMEINDEMGKPMPALTVFSLSILFLKQHLLTTIKQKGFAVKQSDIRWVITVPAIWRESAKQFMREAAKKAGIAADDMKICLEPEAASLYCQHLHVDHISGTGETIMSITKPGTRYMVVDLGGGTADITVHQKMEHGKLKEIHRATGGGWGGNVVNGGFLGFLNDLIDGPAMHHFMLNYQADFLDLFREFEIVKRNVSSNTTGKVNIRAPVNLNTACEEQNGAGRSIQSILADPHCQFKDRVSWLGDKLRIDAEIIRSFFTSPLDSIIECIKDIMQNDSVKGVSLMLLVGGFAESVLVQEAIRKSFKDLKIVVPTEPGLAVLKGALIYGHRPDMIGSRVLKMTYGIQIVEIFDEKIHPKSLRVYKDRVPYCLDVFSIILGAGEEVEAGRMVHTEVCTTKAHQKSIPINIYTSTSPCPQFVTDQGCVYLGTVSIDVHKPSSKERVALVTFLFGDTEVKVTAIDQKSGKTCQTVFSFMQENANNTKI